MRKLLLALVVALAPLAALADGTAKLEFIGEMAGFDLQMQGDTITGWVNNLGHLMDGQVELKKVNGQWTGHMGMAQIVSGAPIMTSANEGKLNLSISSLGQQNFSIKLKPNELHISGLLSNGTMLNGGLLHKGKELSSYSDLVEMSLEKKSEGVWEGSTFFSQPASFGFPVTTELNTTGSLTPEELAVNDRPLFVLLYMLPLH